MPGALRVLSGVCFAVAGALALFALADTIATHGEYAICVLVVLILGALNARHYFY